LTGRASRLESLVRSRRFVVTSEVVPPRSGDLEAVLRQARELVGYVDAVNVTDNPAARAHMSPLAGVAAAARAGIEPTLQLTVRDRNRLALTADLLGAWALGARNLLCMSGDPIGVGDDPDAAPVGDLSITELVRLASAMRAEGRLATGAQVPDAPRYFIGVADSPLAPGYDVGRLEAKLDAGAAFVMTQIAYDLPAIAAWADLLRARGVADRAALIVGVAPLRSADQARALHERLPGVRVPDPLIAELERAGDGAESLGTERCAELVRGLRDTTGIAGVHVMGLGEAGPVRRVLEESGLLPRPTARTT
jgi:methylenetetrahydrofolate reductase (NADPH)